MPCAPTLNPALEEALRSALDRALREAERFRGATAPNPPVGAAALDADGVLLGVAAHRQAGTAHAEASLLSELESANLAAKVHTLVVTLEPCNHHGRTPPCSEAILKHPGIRHIVYASPDSNPRVLGGGAVRLKENGREVTCWQNHEPNSPLTARAEALIAPFVKWSLTGRPWVTVKQALDAHGSMIPPDGRKTFTSEKSLHYAHELRKRADAILTGSGTILADQPHFTVRRVPDHPGKSRWLAVLDRRNRVPESYLAEARARGFQAGRFNDLEKSLKFLGSQGVHEVLVEAGPELTRSLLEGGFWDIHVVIQSLPTGDRITEHPCSAASSRN